LAGIKQTPSSVGFSEVVIEPPEARVLVQSSLYSVEATTVTPYGPIKSAWEVTGGVQCRQVLPQRATSISCSHSASSADGGVISSIYLSHECSETSPATDVLQTSELKDSLINCVGKLECVVPPFMDTIQGAAEGLVVKAVCSQPPQLRVEAVIAPNTIGYVHVNKLNLGNHLITESGQTLWQNSLLQTRAGVLGVKETSDRIILKVGSGHYNFQLSGTPGKLICGVASAASQLDLECPANSKISMVSYASYGSPQLTGEDGDCGAFAHGNFHAGSSVAVVEQLCLNKEKCQVPVDGLQFGVQEREYGKDVKTFSLAVAVYCS